MSVQIGLDLVSFVGFLWILLIAGIWMLLYAYGEQEANTPALAK